MERAGRNAEEMQAGAGHAHAALDAHSSSNVSFRGAERFLSLPRAERGEKSGRGMRDGNLPPRCLATLGMTGVLYDGCRTGMTGMTPSAYPTSHSVHCGATAQIRLGT
jgi:hypothetical protein